MLWSGVAASFFNAPPRASSAHVESYFKHLKADLEPIIPGRVDEVVIAHIDLIEGMILDASQNYIEFVDAAGGLQKLLSDKAELIDDYENYAIVSYDIDKQDDAESNENVSEPNQNDSMQNFDLATHQVDVQDVTELNENVTVKNDNLDDTESNQTDSGQKSITACIACQRGDIPSGAHCCIKCKKAVHIFEGCSDSIGGEEGYGEKRICISCAAETRVLPTKQSSKKSDSIGETGAKQLSQTEKWQRKTKSTRSYLAPVPNWNVDRRVQGTPKILLLTNASLSTTVHTVAKKKVALRNTCAADSLFQVN